MLAQNQYATNASPANSAVIQPIGASLSINQSIIKSYYTGLFHHPSLKLIRTLVLIPGVLLAPERIMYFRRNRSL